MRKREVRKGSRGRKGVADDEVRKGKENITKYNERSFR